MFHNLMPLRTTVGKPIRMQKLEVSARSAAVEEAGMEVSLKLRQAMSEVANESYADYLPRRIDLTAASSFEMFDGVVERLVVELRHPCLPDVRLGSGSGRTPSEGTSPCSSNTS